jgi:hypothetical protein
MMRADLTPDERETLSKMTKNPRLVIQLTPQLISNKKFLKTTSVALEVRVPVEHERIYLEILDRLNERASLLQEGEVDIVLDERIGIFSPTMQRRTAPSYVKTSCENKMPKCSQHWWYQYSDIPLKREKQLLKPSRRRNDTPINNKFSSEHSKNNSNGIVSRNRKISCLN